MLRPGSFSAKIFYLFTVFAVFVYIGISAFYIFEQNRSIRSHLLEEGSQLVRMFAQSARMGVYAGDSDLLTDLWNVHMRGIINYRDALLVEVYTAEGEQMISRGRSGHKELIDSDISYAMDKLAGSLDTRLSIVILEGEEGIEFWAPIFIRNEFDEEEMLYYKGSDIPAGSEVIGFARIVLSTASMKGLLSASVMKGLFVPAGFILLGWVITLWIVRGVTRPLKRLTEGVRNVDDIDSLPIIPVESGGEISELTEAFNDMTDKLKRHESEKKTLEDQLRHSQKLDAIGTFTGGIAHDFNNILSVIISSGKLLRQSLEKKGSGDIYIDQIQFSAKKASALIRRLLTFSSRQVIDLKAVNMNKIILGFEDMLRRLIGDDIELILYLDEGNMTVYADPGQIEQVLMNLVINARDAMPEGGRITIATESAEVHEESVSVEQGKFGQYVVTTVSDTGTGIAEEIRDRIYDPFYTTKAAGEGTGLGLSVTHGIVQQHNGKIELDTVNGSGTSFRIYLPLSSESVDRENLSEVAAVPGGSETILVAEDNQPLLTIIAKVLTDSGYNLVTAVDGNDAVAKFAQRKDEIDLVLLDVIMPEKNGIEASVEMTAMNPDVKVIYMSGYTDDILNMKGFKKEKANFIIKPIHPDTLLIRIREVFDPA
ncbi:MAG: response regulator [Nitrospira sp.]|nr:response regulator [bacterium]MBL7049212.1 response regulator [Nitrospira sp.]